jgi:hypothetical protein
MEAVRELGGGLTPASANSRFARKVIRRCTSTKSDLSLHRWS